MLKISCVSSSKTVQFPSLSEMFTSTHSSNHVSFCQVIWTAAKLQLELLSPSVPPSTFKNYFRISRQTFDFSFHVFAEQCSAKAGAVCIVLTARKKALFLWLLFHLRESLVLIMVLLSYLCQQAFVFEVTVSCSYSFF